MRLLVTGIEGFVGSHLTEALLRENWEVAGIVWDLEKTANLDGTRSRVELFQCDLRQREALVDILHRVQPEAVIHLAALSSVAESFSDPETTLAVNVNGTLNVLEGARGLPRPPRMLIIGSGEEYGPVTSGLPITEEQALQPRNPYAVSKAAQEMLALMYGASYGLPICCARPFNHIGPRQAPAFVCPSFARQIVEIERNGASGTLRVGNLDAERDFTDVRDVVRAYMALIRSGTPGRTYNVCSGRAVSIRSVLDLLIGMARADVRIEVDPARMRPSDVPRFLGSAARLHQDTGWRPEIPLRQTLHDILEDFRRRA